MEWRKLSSSLKLKLLSPYKRLKLMNEALIEIVINYSILLWRTAHNYHIEQLSTT